jgi:hypothetical protein
LQPLSSLGYLFLAVLIATNRGEARWQLMVTGLWMMFPIMIHAWFMFEQRWTFPSVPLLCVVWMRTWQGLRVWHGRQAIEAAPVVLACRR